MAAVLLIARPIALTTQNLIANRAISANVSNRIRWQNHWYVVRQSWAFFKNDFAGRIANRVMQTGSGDPERWSRCSPASGTF
jgi:ATP-binding cassette subfamily B multidrug efflux pump